MLSPDFTPARYQVLTTSRFDFPNTAVFKILFQKHGKQFSLRDGIRHFWGSRVSFPLAIDNATGETFNAYDVNYVPNFVLIGRDGRIISDRVADYDLLIEVRNAVIDPKSGA